jgi:predicted phosphodiesterase
MRLVIFSDVHANLPALRAIQSAIQVDGYDLAIHTGDVLAIGPSPAECLDLLLNLPRTRLIMGNHDAYFAFGIPQPLPPYLSEGEYQHQLWTHQQIDPALRPFVAEWPYVIEQEIEELASAFLHYALNAARDYFVPVIRRPGVADLDRLFEGQNANLLFFGHDHNASDLSGRMHYINPGSAGCFHTAIARYVLVDYSKVNFTIEHRQVAYDDADLYREFEKRQVPDRDLIYRVFFGGRFSS